MIRLIGIKIIDRIKEAGLTQHILSDHASVITSRLGFHEVTDDVCSREAFIVLHLNGDREGCEKLRADLEKPGGIEIREINIDGNPEKINPVSGKGSVEILCLVVERNKEVVSSVQRILTSYGCNIRTRLGVNEQFFGEPAGLIILELKGDAAQRHHLEKDLKSLPQVHVRTMLF